MCSSPIDAGRYPPAAPAGLRRTVPDGSWIKRMLPRTLFGRSILIIVTPLVLLYQSWTYYVFRARISGEEVRSPAELLEPESPSPAS